MYEYHDQYKRARERGDVEAQTRWVNQLRWEIARHAVGEEIVVYPLMEKHLGDKGKKLADHDREEHTVRSHLLERSSKRIGFIPKFFFSKSESERRPIQARGDTSWFSGIP